MSLVPRAAGIALAALVALALAAPPAAMATFPGRNGAIAFGTTDVGTIDIVPEEGFSGYGGIEVVKPFRGDHGRALVDSEMLAQVVPEAAEPFGSPEFAIGAPSYSANGSLVAFAAGWGWMPVSGPPEERIFVIGANGGGLRRVTADPGVKSADDDPSFSPDGRHLVFDRTVSGTHSTQIFRVNLDGSGLVRLTGGERVRNSDPRYSPDGRRIVFDGGRGIEAMRPDGSRRRVLIPKGGGVESFDPDFSPDGRRLAFVRWSARRVAVFTARTDGRRPRRLTPWRKTTDRCHRTMCPSSPIFSPDGRWVLYEQSNDYSSDLEATHSDGRGRERAVAVASSGSPFHPSWQPLPRRDRRPRR
jgi:Tol biopolymer transport system component